MLSGQEIGYGWSDEKRRSSGWEVRQLDGAFQSFLGDRPFSGGRYKRNGDSGMHAIALLR